MKEGYNWIDRLTMLFGGFVLGAAFVVTWTFDEVLGLIEYQEEMEKSIEVCEMAYDSPCEFFVFPDSANLHIGPPPQEGWSS